MVMDQITDVLCSRIISLIEDDLLKPSLQMTDLDDDTLMIRMMADKGGTFMASKIGLTVMNCVNPNSVESFDLFASLNAPDSYYNWKLLLLKYKAELDFYYNTESPPIVQLVEMEGDILATFVHNISNGNVDTVWDSKMAISRNMEQSSEGRHHGGPYCITKETKMQLLQDSRMTWGICLLHMAERDEVV